MPVLLFRSHFVRANLLAALSLLYLSAEAQKLPPPSRTVYKCEIDGKVVYSDDPCPGAEKLNIEPTRGLDRYSGKARTGADVRRERRDELLAEAVRPLTGMDAKELKVFERRHKLSPEARRTCYRLDSALRYAEQAEGKASKTDRERPAVPR